MKRPSWVVLSWMVASVFTPAMSLGQDNRPDLGRSL
ncbi:MAG: hypothetical protein AWU57_1088 [Marinobacter sp. T13-3]|nr:MAG: hypothetical protein AWU57_1088 [Marinobacter sp. T13-3]